MEFCNFIYQYYYHVENFCGIASSNDQQMKSIGSQMDILSVQKHVNNWIP